MIDQTLSLLYYFPLYNLPTEYKSLPLSSNNLFQHLNRFFQELVYIYTLVRFDIYLNIHLHLLNSRHHTKPALNFYHHRKFHYSRQFFNQMYSLKDSLPKYRCYLSQCSLRRIHYKDQHYHIACMISGSLHNYLSNCLDMLIEDMMRHKY